MAAAALTLALVGISSGAALADDYTPDTPPKDTIAGSSASAACVDGVPYINYSVVLTDPDGQAGSHTAYLRLSKAGESIELKLGELVDNKLSGSIVWPGANADGSKYPGWTKVGGTWTPTSGNFAWTRGDITAVIHVNPDLTVPLSYPAAASGCADPTAVSAESPDSAAVLATTGGTVSLVAAGLGAGAMSVGLGLTLRRRRARH
jgi:hypothetical protein